MVAAPGVTGVSLFTMENRMEFAFTDEQTTSAPAERDLVPEGIHEMEIIHAEEGPNQWKITDDNPQGMCLKLRLKLDDYKFVFHDIPQHLGWMAKRLADAIDSATTGDVVSLEPDDLVGKVVRVKIDHYTSKAGRVSAVVDRYLPASSSKSAAKRSKNISAVALADEKFEDDIPF